ncbi:MAG: MarR family transcriptional regulator [Roseobacter sp.]|jgi:DNA-binding MarR family transcriptional regulator|nr:MarR family transcriptional regulator [Roseobacter sp.]
MTFDLSRFLPYLLNQAAETVSAQFQPQYRERYGMLRTEWRVLFHLGRQSDMTARDICAKAMLHKTKVSRAVHALEKKGFLRRTTSREDRRAEQLSLSPKGQRVFEDLTRAASGFERDLAARLSEAEVEQLRLVLAKLIGQTK